MKKMILFVLFFVSAESLFSQSVSLLEKYRVMALNYNHDLKAAEKNIAVSMELEKSAKADLKPKLGAGGHFQYTGNPAELNLNLPSAGKTVKFEGADMQYGASLSLSQPLYTGKRILESIRLAQLQQSVAIGRAEMIRTAVCYQTDIQYWNTVARQEIVKVTEDFYKSIMVLTAIIQERVEAGLVDPQDLLMVEVKLNEAKFQLLQAQNNYETGRMAFNSLIGIELQNPTEIEKTIPAVIAYDTLLQKNSFDRPEVRIAQDQIKIAESNLNLKDSRYKPQLFVGIDGSYSAPGYNFQQDMDLNYIAYARLSVPIFEWGKRRSEKRASAEQIGIATDNLSKAEDYVILEVQTAKVALQQALEQVALSGSSLEKAEENEKKAMERYSEGKVSVLEVIDAQTYRQNSQFNYIQAKIAAQYSYSDLLKALNSYGL